MDSRVDSGCGSEGTPLRIGMGVRESIGEGRCTVSSNFGRLVDYASDSNDEVSAVLDSEIWQNARDLSVLDGTFEEDSEAFSVSDVQLEGEKSALAISDVGQGQIRAMDFLPRLNGEVDFELASGFISHLDKKMLDDPSSMDIDSQARAMMLVSKAQQCLNSLPSKTPGDGAEAPFADEHCGVQLKKTVALRLTRLLLESPKTLLRKYRDCVTSARTTSNYTSTEEKIKEFELQILLRLEIILSGEDGLLEISGQDQFVEDICKLLDSIQYHLDGGIFGGKSLQQDYCNRLMSNRYKDSIPSVIAKIFSLMELDGYPEPSVPSAAIENLKVGDSHLPSRTGEVLVCDLDGEAGSHRSASLQENMSYEAHVKVASSSHCKVDAAYKTPQAHRRKNSIYGGKKGDSQLPVKSTILHKIQTENTPFYHFGAGNLRLVRTFKSVKKSKVKPFEVPAKSRIPAKKSYAQGFRETANPDKSCTQIYHGADEVTQPLIPPTKFTGFTPLVNHDSRSVEQSPFVVKETPVAKQRATSHNGSKGIVSGKVTTCNLNERFVTNSMSSGIISSPAICRSKIRANLSDTKSCKRPAVSRQSASVTDSSILSQGVDSGLCPYPILLQNSSPQPLMMAETRESGSYLGRHLPCADGDDDEDEDEDGIVSTPAKNSHINQSLTIPHSQCLERSNYQQLLGQPRTDVLLSDGHTARERPGRPSSRALKSVTPPSARPHAMTRRSSSVVPCKNMSPPQDAQPARHKIGHELDGEKENITFVSRDHFWASGSLVKDCSELSQLPALPPESPLRTIFVNPGHRQSSMNNCQYLNTAKCFVEAEVDCGATEDRGSQPEVPRTRSTKPVAGKGTAEKRKTFSESYMELTKVPVSPFKSRSQNSEVANVDGTSFCSRTKKQEVVNVHGGIFSCTRSRKRRENKC